MARKKRLILPGYCYHVMARGVGGRNIFEDDYDRARFCLMMQYASESSGFSIHGFCLMKNHVHLLLQAHNTNFSAGMHSLLFRYAQYYNKKINRKGYLFQSRYKAILVQHGIYLRRLIRYIHRNPVRANLIPHPSEYVWSSQKAYISSFNNETTYSWLKTDLITDLFSNEPTHAQKSFEDYITANDSEAKAEIDEIRQSTSIGAYGTALFVQEFEQSLEVAPDIVQANQLQTCHPQPLLEHLIYTIDKCLHTTLEELQSPNKSMELVEARIIFAWLFKKLNLGKTRDLANILKREPTSIARLIEKANESEMLQYSASQLLTTVNNVKTIEN
ncbi:MAG: transposase [Chlamydiales bacterium]|nr:transposase [Chlamydiales bacterium]